MPAEDRRSSPRFLLFVPVRFHHCTGGEITTHAVNISRSGLFLRSPQKLAIGTSLQMSLRVPTEISGSVFTELRCRGRVVHEQQEEGAPGYGIEIEQMTPGFRPLRGEFASAARI
jgi:hypothetical protein